MGWSGAIGRQRARIGCPNGNVDTGRCANGKDGISVELAHQVRPGIRLPSCQRPEFPTDGSRQSLNPYNDWSFRPFKNVDALGRSLGDLPVHSTWMGAFSVASVSPQ